MKTIDEVLLAHGGERVCHQGDEFDGPLVCYGRLMSPKRVVLKKGRERNCHRNTSGLYLFNYPDFRITTGYALHRGIWLRHSWLLAGSAIIETTERFSRYFGVTLDDLQAARFVIGDVFDMCPHLAAMCDGKAGGDTPVRSAAGGV